MSAKCPRCGKTVYFAERQTAEGRDWHGICLMEAIKEKKAQASKHMFCIDAHPNLDPAKQPAAGGKAGGFCSQCGTGKAADDKFCSNCGNRF